MENTNFTLIWHAGSVVWFIYRSVTLTESNRSQDYWEEINIYFFFLWTKVKQTEMSPTQITFLLLIVAKRQKIKRYNHYPFITFWKLCVFQTLFKLSHYFLQIIAMPCIWLFIIDVIISFPEGCCLCDRQGAEFE